MEPAADAARRTPGSLRRAGDHPHAYPGQAPRIVEDQVTYPLTTTMMSVPGAKTVRGYSFFGESFVYILFEDGTDPYWARSRVLEYMSQVQVAPAGTGETRARA
jgi:Cu/Ag efflux pump CusA